MINDAPGIIRRPVRISRPIPPALPRRQGCIRARVAARPTERLVCQPERCRVAQISIRSVDTCGWLTRGLGPPAGSISGCAEPFYGTMAGPGWYHAATSVLRARNPPFSLLRMLMQLSRRADIPVRSKIRMLPGFATPVDANHSTLGFKAIFSRMGCWLGGTAPLGASCL